MRISYNDRVDRYTIEDVTAQDIENMVQIINTVNCRECGAFMWCYESRGCTDWYGPIYHEYRKLKKRKGKVVLDEAG